MTYSSQTPTSTPSWIDCFATDDGRIIVVGGGFQLLVYNIGTSSWSDTATPASSIIFGPNVSSNMFLNPVYIQSRILADGFTALVVCTLTWNSQPQPYYLDTNTWLVTLAIGTSQTTPPGTTGALSGWGAIPGGGTLLPPAGFRHYTLAILGQDKNEPKKNYGNGRAFIIGGYSTLVTGQVQDWDAITSFPVQQAPSNVVVMFGNMGSLPKITRGSAAYPVSPSQLDIFPGNGGGSSTQQQIVVFDKNQNVATMLSGITGGPRNTMFRGATVIGQGQQIFLHGGLKSLDFSAPQESPPLDYLDQSVGVWNGGSQQWGDTVDIYTPKKSNSLMIGVIAGGVALVLLIVIGIWFIRRRRRMRMHEEEERQTKGMVLKSEDMLQKEHRVSRNGDSNPSSGTTPVVAFAHPLLAGYPHAETGTHSLLKYSNGLPSEQNYSQIQNPYAKAESIMDEFATQAATATRIPHAPQEYPPSSTINEDASSGDISRSPSHYQTVVSVPGRPLYGMGSYGIAKQELTDIVSAPEPLEPSTLEDLENLRTLRASLDGSSQTLLGTPHTQRDSSLDIRPYTRTSSTSFTQYGGTYQSPYMSSPAFSATYSMPDSAHGSDTAGSSLIR
ncbi:hypothetical protein BGZ54_005993 [Gamsiella multidivaricata]|nr:hypothetical protein BGZ54_005993 [Gamsiella multidivaricata]